MNGSKIIGAIEIGTAKVVVLVAEIHSGRSMTIIGKAETTNTGMKRGEIVQLRPVSDCTHAAIVAAEAEAGAQIEEVYLSMTGTHLQGFQHAGMTSIASRSNAVTQQDLQRATDNARNKALAAGMVYLHHVKQGYLLDGIPVDDPVDRIGSQLELRYWHIAGDELKIKEQMRVVNGLGLEVSDIVVSSIASGSLLATDAEKRQGVLVLDIGKGTTDYILYKEGRVVLTGVIPVGGEHVTNDLSLGLRTKPKYAENLKLRAARAMVSKLDREQRVPIVGDLMIGDGVVSQLTINKITHARLEELFMILKNRLGSLITRAHLPAGVILTGGVSKTPLIDELAEVTLDVPAARGSAPDWVHHDELREPEYATVLGLLYNALNLRTEAVPQPPKTVKRMLFGRMKEMFA